MDATLLLWNFIQREAQNMHLSPKKKMHNCGLRHTARCGIRMKALSRSCVDGAHVRSD